MPGRVDQLGELGVDEHAVAHEAVRHRRGRAGDDAVAVVDDDGDRAQQREHLDDAGLDVGCDLVGLDLGMAFPVGQPYRDDRQHTQPEADEATERRCRCRVHGTRVRTHHLRAAAKAPWEVS